MTLSKYLNQQNFGLTRFNNRPNNSEDVDQDSFCEGLLKGLTDEGEHFLNQARVFLLRFLFASFRFKQFLGLEKYDFEGHLESALVRFARVRTKNELHHEFGAKLQVLVLNDLSASLDFVALGLASERSLQIILQVYYCMTF